ncbi:wax ester/triacylglycerol synthase family O-acyltransferase [Azohydromonas caseinilytica]|uniref:diacylglycerol O-acyltransferase n=1 Tax=Azohydromonas caseinilytica TaxID=2728836 RepID=A0A848FFU7_9BURK|nr:wax ester/triacylglycerol synthase family O-acyltransferase [Azohydromonas caseinilytica]NML17123.1 wax ester/triacylglycerol synthase family O-acyltransferase [Azohydromonas caseinilytica]
MNAATRRARMSGVDTAWLRMERPTNPMMITGVLVLKARLDPARLKRLLRVRLLAFERFRQRPVGDAGDYWWEDDPDFDLERHVHRVALPRPGGKPELQDLVSDLASTPLDAGRPMWQLHLVEGYRRTRSALVLRVHHCYADGAALMQVLLALAAAGPKAPTRGQASAEPPGWLPWLGELTRASTGLFFELLQHPGKLIGYAQAGAAAMEESVRLLAMAPEPRTRLRGKLGLSKRVAWCEPLPLDAVKAVGRALECTLNDVLLAAAAGALRAYLVAHHDRVQGLEIRVVVPVNLRAAQAAEPLGNEFGLVFLTLPVGVADPVQRVRAVHAHMQALRHSSQPLFTLGLLDVAGQSPRLLQEQLVQLLGSHATAVMTNVPGPRRRLRLAGVEIEQPMFWVPQAGDIALGASILSYAGQVQFGLMADAGTVRDPERIAAYFAGEIGRLQEAAAWTGSG